MKYLKCSLATVCALSLAVLALPSQAEEVAPSQQCLMCHGPSFDDLRAKTKDWKDEFGDAMQPHVYLDSKAAKPHQGAKVVPDCLACHDKHPLPILNGYQHKQPSFSTCYGCHHMENFQKCTSSGCHEPK